MLWLVWPLVLFFPMWMSPLLVESQKDDGSDSYALMTEQLLPHGLLGLVIVGFFSHTMAMCSSDANAIAAVFTRDICAPVIWRKGADVEPACRDCAPPAIATRRLPRPVHGGGDAGQLARLQATSSPSSSSGSPGLMGPMAIPMMLGLLRPFRQSGPTAALHQLGVGLIAFWLVNYPINWNVEGGVPLQYQVSIPLAVSLVLYILVGYIKPEDTPERDGILAQLNPGGGGGLATAAVPGPTPAGDTVGDTTARSAAKE